LIKGCIYSLFLYASSIYFDAVGEFRSVVNKIRKAQRLMNIMCSRSYRDISFAASTVMAGIPPLDLLIEKRTIMYCIKKEITPIPWTQVGTI